MLNTIQGQTTNDGAGDQSKNETGPSSDVTIYEWPSPEDGRIAGEADSSTYHHKSGELYA